MSRLPHPLPRLLRLNSSRVRCGGDSAKRYSCVGVHVRRPREVAVLKNGCKQRIAGNGELDVRADYQRQTMIALRRGEDKERRDALRAISRGLGLRLHMWNKDMLGVMIP
jgi:hypothetical protein